MSKDKLRQEYKAHWDAELKRRDQLNQAIGLPITLITGLSGAVFYLVRDVTHPIGRHTLLTLIFVGLGCYFLAVAAAYLVRSVLRNPYTFPPTPKELEKHRSDMPIRLVPAQSCAT